MFNPKEIIDGDRQISVTQDLKATVNEINHSVLRIIFKFLSIAYEKQKNMVKNYLERVKATSFPEDKQMLKNLQNSKLMLFLNSQNGI